MEFSGQTARDLPAPALLREDANRFTAPVFLLAPQPRLQVVGHSTTATGGQLDAIAISYSYLANPAQPDARENFVEHIDEIEGWIRKADEDDQPAWFKDAVRRSRYPMLWEATLTATDPSWLRNLDEHLAHHINHTLINTMSHRRHHRPDGIPELDYPVRPNHTQPATLTLDGREISGRTIDTDPDIVGWAARTVNTYVSLALPRDLASTIDPSLVQLTSEYPLPPLT